MDKDSLPNTLRNIAITHGIEYEAQSIFAGADEIEHLEGVIEKHEAQLRIINSLLWRLVEARNIGHEVEERSLDLEEYICSVTPLQETNADRAAAIDALKAIGRI